MRRVLSLVALGLLVVPLVHAAASGARPPIEADQPVNDVAIAATAGRFAAATNDPGSRLSGTSSAVAWRLWNLDGSERTAGGNDPEGCPNNPEPVTEDCQTRVTRIAVNAAGTRIAVGGQTGPGGSGGNGNAIVGLFTDTGANLFTEAKASGTLNALDISASGSRVVAGGQLPGPSGQAQDTADGFLMSLDSAGGLHIDATLESPVTAVAVDADGSRLVAGAGYHIRASPASSTLHENKRSDGTSSVQGSVRAVDVSDHDNAWSVAGYDSGYFAVFSDSQGGPGTPSSASVQDYQKREAGDTVALTGVAIRPNATAFVTGSSAGRLRLYTMDPSIDAELTAFQPTLASTLDNVGAVIELAFSGDGRYLAARAGGGIRFYDTQGDKLTELWRDDRTGMANAVAVDGRGEHVVAAVGTTVLVYDAIHRLTASFPSATQSPGASTTHALSYRNDGNRADRVTLVAEPPTGVTVSLTPSTFTIRPGQSQSVQAVVTLPSTQAPGSLAIPLRNSINGGADGAGTNTLTLSVPTSRGILFEPQGATSRGATASSPALFDVSVRNTGNVQESVALSLVGAPAGWAATVEPSSLTLPAGASGNVTVSMMPPGSARDGDSATVALRRDGGAATPVELTATVGAYFQVRLAVPAGSVLEGGRSGLVDATVHNEGNAVDSILVKLNALPAGWRGGFLNGLGELQVEDIEAGGSRVVQVSLMPPASAVSDVPVQVTLTAQSLGDPARSTSKGVLVTVVDENATASETDTETGGGNGIPGPGPLVLVGVLALAAVAVRRRKA